MIDIPFRSKEVSWLSFNARVLQEAQSPDVPLLERLKFLGIYSSNLDEFFRVRVATLRRLVDIGVPHDGLGIPDPKKTLREVNLILKRETEVFNQTYAEVFGELEKEHIKLITDEEVPEELRDYLDEFLEHEVLPSLMPITIKSTSELSNLRDRPMYLAVRMSKSSGVGRGQHALIEIPDELPRFHVLPKLGQDQLVMYVDDVIRFGLHKVFESTQFDQFESYALKFTRDAEWEFDNDFTESFYEQVSEGLKSRLGGGPVRVNFDEAMPRGFLRLVLRGLELNSDEGYEYPGARYHNRKDLMKFPNFGRKSLQSKKLKPLVPVELQSTERFSMLRILREQDLLLHFPYHSFNHFIDLLREVSIDPLVKSIKLTQYRLAKKSCVARALITAVQNGKEVFIMVEPTARFDEEANIGWAQRYRDAGVQVVLGVPGLKVHTKLCLVERLESGQPRHYSCLGTGNFNEDTATLYTDHMLMTSNQEIGNDVDQIFKFFQRTYKAPTLKHLSCAPFSLRKKIYQLIDAEIEQAKAGNEAEIWIKINNLSDVPIVRRLYKASKAGVKLRMIVRSMFSLITEDPEYSENIEAIGIVDQLLEHTRILRFHNQGDPSVFLSSADFLPRNFDSRCETLVPIYDKELKGQLIEYLDLQWQDNVKSRILDKDLTNEMRRPESGQKEVRSQIAIQKFLQKLSRGSSRVSDSNED